MILFDSNVLIAALLPQHPHFQLSHAMVERAAVVATMIAAHSLAECYSTLTRPNRPYLLSGASAADAIERLAADSHVVALSGAQTIDAIRRFAPLGTGPRLYDYLIGATGEAYGAHTIATWNTRDFTGLFPAMRIATPAELLA